MTLATKILTLEGEARERGFQYGSLAKTLIHRNIETYQRHYKMFAKLDWKTIIEGASSWIPIIREYDSEILDEMGGIASGCERSLEEIVALNARYEFSMTPLSGRAGGECTSFAVTSDAASSDEVVLGQNWDWRSTFKETCVLLNMKQTGGRPNIVSHVEAGIVAHKGLNSSGLGLCINALLSDRDRVAPGVPLVSVVARKILNSKTIGDAIRAVTKAERSASINFMIAHSGGEAVDLEVTPHDVAILHPEDGILTHSNNFLSPNVNLMDLGKTVFPDSPIRWNRMKRLLIRKKKYSLRTLRTATSDHFDYPNSICRHPDPRSHPDSQFETITSIVMNLAKRRLFMTEGNPCKGLYKVVPIRP